jgi:hypothetical protein
MHDQRLSLVAAGDLPGRRPHLDVRRQIEKRADASDYLEDG